MWTAVLLGFVHHPNLPLKQRRSVAKPLECFTTHYLNRDEAIAAAYGTGAYTLQAVVDYFDIGRMTVNRFKAKGAEDEKWETRALLRYLSKFFAIPSLIALDSVYSVPPNSALETSIKLM